MRNVTRSRIVPAAVTLTGLLAGWVILTVSQSLARSFNLVLYLLANVVFFVDFFDLILRLYLRRLNASMEGPTGTAGTSIALDIGRYTDYQKRLHLRPYAIMVSVHNAEDEIDAFLEAMEAYRERIWIIDDASTDNTFRRIRQSGWRCLEGDENRKKPGAIRRLLQSLPPEIETVLVIDPDITIRDSRTDELSHLENVIFEFQRSGMAALCPRIAIRKDGFLARLQGLEYCMAFSLGRMSLADHAINSGVSIYRRSALEAIFKQHSLSVYAEDLENSLILLGAGEDIYYDSRLVVDTEGKRTWSGWFSQRVGWAFGLIKVYLEHFTEIRRAARRRLSAAYQFIVYMGAFCLLLHPLKIIALVILSLSLAKGLDMLFGFGVVPDWKAAEPVYFLAAFVKYTLLSFLALFGAVPRRERAYLLPVAPLYFFYALAQIVPCTVGYANWLSVRIWGRRLLADHFQDELSFRRQHKANGMAKRGQAI